jgi:hypothetical protein
MRIRALVFLMSATACSAAPVSFSDPPAQGDAGTSTSSPDPAPVIVDAAQAVDAGTPHVLLVAPVVDAGTDAEPDANAVDSGVVVADSGSEADASDAGPNMGWTGACAPCTSQPGCGFGSVDHFGFTCPPTCSPPSANGPGVCTDSFYMGEYVYCCPNGNPR